MPLIVRHPTLPNGQVSHAPVELVDLMPTWLEAASLEVPPYLPGRSVQPLLEGQAPEAASWREASFSEQYTLATEVPGAAGPRGQCAIREPRYKLIFRAGARSALYDLQEDPNELDNLVDDPTLGGVRERLLGRMVRGMIDRVEKFPTEYRAQVATVNGPPTRYYRTGTGVTACSFDLPPDAPCQQRSAALPSTLQEHPGIGWGARSAYVHLELHGPGSRLQWAGGGSRREPTPRAGSGAWPSCAAAPILGRRCV